MKNFALIFAASVAALPFCDGTLSACFRQRRVICLQPVALTPDIAKQALLEMMRSKSGQTLGFFDKSLVDEMAKLDVEKKKDEYHWTGAFRLDPQKATYVLFVSMGDKRPPLRPHPKGYLMFLHVFEGSFEMKDGRWTATIPKYKYALLD